MLCLTKGEVTEILNELNNLNLLVSVCRHDDVKQPPVCHEMVALRTNDTIRTNDTNDTNVVTKTIAPDKSAAPVSEIKKVFMESYQTEFGRPYPAWGAKENGMIAKWLKSTSLDTAKRLAALYPKWNDAWVTRQGHPLGILIAQYVQLDAWAGSSTKLIQKIAAGKAAETNLTKKAIAEETMKHGLEQKRRQRISNSENTTGLLGLVSSETTGGIPRKLVDDVSG